MKLPLKLLRIGPNLLFTVIIFLFALLEIVFSPARSMHGLKNQMLFHGFIVSFSLFTWLTGVWLFWFFSKLLVNISPRPYIRSTMLLLSGFVAWVFLSFLASLWAVALYVGKFPNLDSMRMSRTDTGVSFILSFIEETIPTAKFFVIGFVGVSIVAVPWLTKKMLQARWPSEDIRLASRKMASYTWLISAGTALCCYMYIIIDTDLFVRLLQIPELKTKSTPAFVLSVSAVETWQSTDETSPDIQLAALVPIAPPTLPVKPDKPLRNVLYLALESFRQDLLFQKVDGVEVTPRINELATSSQLFMNAHSQATHTDYAMPAYMSSLYSLRQPLHHFYGQSHTWPKTLIYDHLAQYNYRSAIITADNTAWGGMRNFFLSDNLDVFFDSENMPGTFIKDSSNRGYVTNPESGKVNGSNTYPDDKTVDIAKSWIKIVSTGNRPWVLHTMLQQTHFPYTLRADYPKPFQPCDADFKHTFFNCPPDKIPVLKNIYYNAAHAVDLEVGKFIDYLTDSGQLDHTMIVIVGDHGEAFNEQGLQSHAGPNIEQVLRVPMMIYDPAKPGQKIDYPAEQVDMAPTLCGLLGIPPSPVFQGIDLLSSDKPPLEKRNTFASTAVAGHWNGDVVINAGRWKFSTNNANGTHKLFDLKSDPLGEKDIQLERPQITAGLKRLLQNWRQNQLAYYKYEMFYGKYYPPRNLPVSINATSTTEISKVRNPAPL